MIFIGVLMFSYIMNEFIDILVLFKNSDLDFGEGDKLKLFLGVLNKFNENEQIEYKKEFEAYF